MLLNRPTIIYNTTKGSSIIKIKIIVKYNNITIKYNYRRDCKYLSNKTEINLLTQLLILMNYSPSLRNFISLPLTFLILIISHI